MTEQKLYVTREQLEAEERTEMRRAQRQRVREQQLLRYAFYLLYMLAVVGGAATVAVTSSYIYGWAWLLVGAGVPGAYLMRQHYAEQREHAANLAAARFREGNGQGDSGDEIPVFR